MQHLQNPRGENNIEQQLDDPITEQELNNDELIPSDEELNKEETSYEGDDDEEDEEDEEDI